MKFGSSVWSGRVKVRFIKALLSKLDHRIFKEPNKINSLNLTYKRLKDVLFVLVKLKANKY